METAALLSPSQLVFMRIYLYVIAQLSSVYAGPTYEATGHPLAQGVVRVFAGRGQGKRFHQHCI